MEVWYWKVGIESNGNCYNGQYYDFIFNYFKIWVFFNTLLWDNKHNNIYIIDRVFLSHYLFDYNSISEHLKLSLLHRFLQIPIFHAYFLKGLDPIQCIHNILTDQPHLKPIKFSVKWLTVACEWQQLFLLYATLHHRFNHESIWRTAPFVTLWPSLP